MTYPYNNLTQDGSTRSFGFEHTLHIGRSATGTSPDGEIGAFLWLPKGPISFTALLSWANLVDDPGRVELYESQTGFIVAVIDVAATTTPTAFTDTGFVPQDGYYGIRMICESVNTLNLHGVHLEFRREREAAVEWQDLTAQAGYTFARTSAATDGAPEVGIPAGNLSSYSSGVLRDVSAKVGVASDYWYLLEGARTNLVLRSLSPAEAGWGPAGTATLTGSQADPFGGTSAARVESPSGNNMYLTTIVSPPMVPTAHSAFVRQGPGTGVYQFTAINPEQAVGGTVGPDWIRVGFVTTPNANNQHRAGDAGNRSLTGGLPAGDRDAVYYGFQLESGAFPTSYIPTTGVAVTRQEDQLAINLPAAWTSNKLIFEYVPEHDEQAVIDGLQCIFMLDDATASRGVVMNQDGGVARIIVTDGTAIAEVQFSSAFITSGFTAGDTIRLEIDWDNQFVRLFVNGQYEDASYFVGGTASLAPYTGTQFHIGHDGAGATTVWGLLRVGVV